jgi:hypothetical protein
MDYLQCQALLRRLAKTEGLAIAEDVFAFLADVVPRDERELRAAVLFVATSAALAHEPISIDAARRALADPRWRERIARLDATVAFCAGFSERDIENPAGFRSFAGELSIWGRVVAIQLPFPDGPRDGRRGACWVVRTRRNDDVIKFDHCWDLERVAESMTDGWFVGRAHLPSRDLEEVLRWANMEQRCRALAGALQQQRWVPLRDVLSPTPCVLSVLWGDNHVLEALKSPPWPEGWQLAASQAVEEVGAVPGVIEVHPTGYDSGEDGGGPSAREEWWASPRVGAALAKAARDADGSLERFEEVLGSTLRSLAGSV